MSWKFGTPELDAHHNNLIGVWKLDEASGNRLDGYGSRTLADGSGTTGSDTGKDNLAADFDSANSDYLDNGSEITRNLAQFSISCWIYMNTISVNNYIVWEPDDAGAVRMALISDHNNKLKMQFRDAGGYVFKASSNAFGATTWYHILAVWDTTANKFLAWVNGVEWINENQAMANFKDVAASENWRVGCGKPGGVATYADMRIDELYMWDTALAIADSTALYKSSNGTFWRNRPANFFCNG